MTTPDDPQIPTMVHRHVLWTPAPLAGGAAPRTIKGGLGHSQIALTMDTYSHVMPNIQREAAGLMDRILAANG